MDASDHHKNSIDFYNLPYHDMCTIFSKEVDVPGKLKFCQLGLYKMT